MLYAPGQDLELLDIFAQTTRPWSAFALNFDIDILTGRRTAYASVQCKRDVNTAEQRPAKKKGQNDQTKYFDRRTREAKTVRTKAAE